MNTVYIQQQKCIITHVHKRCELNEETRFCETHLLTFFYKRNRQEDCHIFNFPCSGPNYNIYAALPSVINC